MISFNVNVKPNTFYTEKLLDLDMRQKFHEFYRVSFRKGATNFFKSSRSIW